MSGQRAMPAFPRRLVWLFPLALVLGACGQSGVSAGLDAANASSAIAGTAPPTAAARGGATISAVVAKGTAPASATSAAAVFAGGCFWCMQPPYDKLPGVISTAAGYTGGHTLNPSYEQVSAGGTGHAEAVRVVYDPRQVSYPKLLDVFWHNIDPLAKGRQFCDVGDQYRSAIFPLGAQQASQAQASKQALQADPRFAQGIATTIETASTFYPAEAYHQDYYLKNPLRYKYYRHGCHRDQRLREIWGPAAS